MDIITQLLAYFKKYNGIPEDDTSMDTQLTLALEVVLEIAKKRACNLNKWDNIDDIPKPVLMGILMMVEMQGQRVKQNNLKSESIDGMSQSFGTIGTDEEYFAPVYELFDMYCDVAPNELIFQRAKRGGCCS